MFNLSRQIVLFLLAVTVAAIAGCQPSQTSETKPTAAAPTATAEARPAATPGKFTDADIAKLKWIEGTWRGTGENQPPFFERYRFEGSTMIVDGLEDETGQKVKESSRFELKDGEFGHTEGNSRAAASTITDTAVQFVPVSGSKNSFRFEKQTADTWQAVIEVPATGDKPAPATIYKMERVAKK